MPSLSVSDILVPIKLTYGLSERSEIRFNEFIGWFDLLDFREVKPKQKRKWQYEFTGTRRVWAPKHIFKINIWDDIADDFDDEHSAIARMSVRSIKHMEKRSYPAGSFHHLVSAVGGDYASTIRSLDWEHELYQQKDYLTFCVMAYERMFKTSE